MRSDRLLFKVLTVKVADVEASLVGSSSAVHGEAAGVLVPIRRNSIRHKQQVVPPSAAHLPMERVQGGHF